MYVGFKLINDDSLHGADVDTNNYKTAIQAIYENFGAKRVERVLVLVSDNKRIAPKPDSVA